MASTSSREYRRIFLCSIWQSPGRPSLPYQLDQTKFDRGHLIIVKYERNWDPEGDGSMENEILQRVSVMPIHISTAIYSPSSSRSTRTSPRLDSPPGTAPPLSRSWTGEIFPSRPYNEIPATLNTAVVTISNLSKIPKFSTGRGDVDIVTYGGELFTFKHHGVFPNYALEYEDRCLEEAIYMARLSSPYVLRPSYIVSGKSDGGPLPFRGILYPYLSAGSLADVPEKTAEISAFRQGDAGFASIVGPVNHQRHQN